MMGQVPAWIVRWGITLLFLVVVALLVGSCFFKYPDVITADMTLTGQHPATAVVTRAAGKIQELLVRDNRPVRQGDWLAVIENHADISSPVTSTEPEPSGMCAGMEMPSGIRFRPQNRFCG